MAVSSEELEHIADLADLNLTEAEKAKYSKDLNEILEFAQMINGVDTSNVKETIGANSKYNVFRKDVVNQDFGDREKMLSNTPSVEAGLIHLPNVIN